MRWEDALSNIVDFIGSLFNWLIVKPISWIYKVLRRIVIDMGKHIYGKFIAALVIVLVVFLINALVK
jgi:hypothetical protein